MQRSLSYESQTRMAAPARVLYVEDSDADFYVVQTVFDMFVDGLELHRASDGGQAFAFFRRSSDEPHIDLVLLDINMPGTDGFTVLRLLKSQPSTRDIPVVIFTSSSRRRDQEHALALGAQEFITKPQTLTGMMDILDEVCSKYLLKARQQ